ncbi:MAG TPA: glycoside hydrolase family 97 N-terminal domain-containing protein, partial [Dongiaceae bacterium]|nr:glycoside hydrolase family 97 N-terminal domain-containing protein [Dongiaceae bacterium]
MFPVYLGLTCPGVFAANTISSPDGQVVATVAVSAGNLTYSVNYRGADVIESSPLGATVNGVNLGTGVTVDGTAAYATNETFISRSGIHRMATNWYNDQVITFNHAGAGISYGLNVRVFNTGVAFRYEFADTAAKKITAEASGFVIPAGGTVWYQTATSTYETYYRGTNISQLPANTSLGPPATIQLAGTNGFLVLTESTPGDFGSPYLTKSPGGTGRQLQVTYPVNQDGTTGAAVTGPVNTPWNIIMVGADLNQIINNDIVESLAPPPNPSLFPEGTLTRWAPPGRSVWDWLQPQPGGITYTNAMTNSLWAARLGFEYNTVDAGWSDWNGGNPWPQVQQVVNYSHALGIKVLLWKGSSELSSPAQRAVFFQQLQTYGVDGFKADFFDFNSVSAAARERIQLRQTILQEAAGFHLVANFHGTVKPAGDFRTYPNFIENEGVFGKEQYPNPWMVVSLPFTRFMAGPADYTPLDFGGNTAFEIANVVNMPGPMITYCERSDRIAGSPFASLIRTLPAQWDETLVLSQSQLGQTTATARRTGRDWYVGIMNANATHTWPLPLTFLETNVTYQADLVRQDSTGLERMTVTRSSVLTVTITGTNGSGFVAKFTPVTNVVINPGYKLTGAIIGTPGSWSNSGNTKEKVFDNNLTTFFDGPDGAGDWAGLDFGAGNQKIVSLIQYCPRATYSGRMVPGVFQGANQPDFSDAVDLATVGYAPPEGSYSTVPLTNRTVFRYVRYLSPPDGWCNVAEVQFYGGTNPPAPVNVTATPGQNQIVLTWDGGTDVTYNLLRATNAGGPHLQVASNLSLATFTDLNLVSGQRYYYVVQAVNPVGLNSPDSAEANATPDGPPTTPVGLRTQTGTNQTVTLTWSATLNTTGYLVKRALVSGGPYAVVAMPANTSFTDTGLGNGVTYYYVVTAENARGESPDSAEVTAMPGDISAAMRAAAPVGYWPLDETSGSVAADTSGNGLNGIYQPAVTLGANGVPQSPYFGFGAGPTAAAFNGQINSWVSLPVRNLNSAQATFAAWICPATTNQPGATGLVFCRDGQGTVSGLDYNPGGTQLGYTWNDDGG